MQNTVHFVLQGKGGIGKSFVASLLAQFFITHGANVKCYDTDQENTTLAHYKSLNVRHIPVYNESRVVDAKKFDALIEEILTNEGTFVVDTGANTFSNLLAYMVENDVIGLLEENGRKVFVHTIVGGGDTLLDTANGFNSIALGVSAPLVLWMNEHFGKMLTDDGKDFVDTKVFKNHQEKLSGIIMLHARNSSTFGDDLKRMNTKRLTVDEVMQSKDFSIMEKQRIKTVTRDVFDQLQKVVW
ncbi:hypothetical protein JFK97_19175 [Chromobacterium phragmitis]|uniref:nucleotide-binding protein n=1 Tax=Chromobacterium amazonense TaxID=1382803 RepID=UPI0021B73F84|nr:hypothetical protein [Chromobacterium amazonense]MBM2886516.1 hypothetical protein [Chromobacterium amazonense]